MIIDLFSHKIHSSGDDWPEKLAEIASIFNEFDGQLFNRNEFETRLQRISPRRPILPNMPHPNLGLLAAGEMYRNSETKSAPTQHTLAFII